MDLKEFERNYQIETTYWWNVGRFHIIDTFVKRYIKPRRDFKMVDLGSGTGATTRWLEKFGHIKAVDESALALSYCRRRGLKDLTRSNLERLRLVSSSYNAAFALDILEHVKDDERALGEIRRILKPGGKLLITAPAYQWLFSEHDEVCHHYRRYTLGQMAGKVERMGFKVLRKSYCIVFLFFPLITLLHFRFLFKRDKKIMPSIVPLPNWLNQILIGLLRLENFFLKFFNFPFGVSVILLAERPADR